MPLFPVMGMAPTEFITAACGMSTILNAMDNVDGNRFDRVAIDDLLDGLGALFQARVNWGVKGVPPDSLDESGDGGKNPLRQHPRCSGKCRLNFDDRVIGGGDTDNLSIWIIFLERM